MQAGLLRGDERLHGLDDVAAGEVVGVDLLDVDREAGLGGGDLGVDDHAVRHAAQAHAHEVEDADLGAGEARADPDGQEGEQEEDEQEQGAGGDPDDDVRDIHGDKRGKGFSGSGAR